MSSGSTCKKGDLPPEMACWIQKIFGSCYHVKTPLLLPWSTIPAAADLFVI